MSKRNERIDEEAAALWRALHGAAPPEGCNGVALLDLIVGAGDVAEYRRLSSAWLRDRNLVWPKD